MANAYASTIVDAPIESVWNVVRDFNGLPDWIPIVTDSEIEDGCESDSIGCVRSFHLDDGSHVRERLLALDDHNHSLTYNFETPAFPVEDYLAKISLLPVSSHNQTFIQWQASFEELPEDRGKYEKIVSENVFAAGLETLAVKMAELRKDKSG